MKKIVLTLLLVFIPIAMANSHNLDSKMSLKTVNGDTIAIPKEGPAHLVFIDNWASYGGYGPEAALQALPDSFHKAIPTIWFQPRLNVTDHQLLEYQKAFPASTPLVMDDHLQIMRKFSVKSTPSHVLLENGKVVFSGNTEDFLHHLGYEPVAKTLAESPDDSNKEFSDNSNSAVPSIKDIAPLNDILFSSADTALLIFLDDLCPMDHMPGCEEAVKEISQRYQADDHNWIVIYNGFYSDQSTSKAFSERHNLTMPALFDEDHTLFGRHKVYSTPYFIQVHKSGQVINRSSKLSTLVQATEERE